MSLMMSSEIDLWAEHVNGLGPLVKEHFKDAELGKDQLGFLLLVRKQRSENRLHSTVGSRYCIQPLARISNSRGEAFESTGWACDWCPSKADLIEMLR